MWRAPHFSKLKIVFYQKWKHGIFCVSPSNAPCTFSIALNILLSPLYEGFWQLVYKPVYYATTSFDMRLFLILVILGCDKPTLSQISALTQECFPRIIRILEGPLCSQKICTFLRLLISFFEFHFWRVVRFDTRQPGMQTHLPTPLPARVAPSTGHSIPARGEVSFYPGQQSTANGPQDPRFCSQRLSESYLSLLI